MCRQDVLLEQPDENGFYASSFRFDEIFDKFWQGMNSYYVYWSVEEKDYWNNIYKNYRQKFNKLGTIIPEISNGIVLQDNNVHTAYRMFKEMTAPLHDGHLTITFDPAMFDQNSGGEVIHDRFMIRPTYAKVINRTRIEDSALFLSDWSGSSSSSTNNNFNFFNTTIKNNYINNYSLQYISQNGFPELRAACGTAITRDGVGSILYFYFSAFSLKETLASERGIGQFTTLWTYYLNELKNNNLRGVILDVRGNSGGANADIALVLEPLLKDDIIIAETRTKKTLAPLEYKPWSPYKISPVTTGMTNKDVPVVLLCNDFSISCAELLTLAVKQMPNGYVLGRQTYGALGPRLSDTSPAKTTGGSFSGGPFWINVVQAGLQTRGPDKINYDGIGIPPHRVVELNAVYFSSGIIDSQLSEVILYIDP